MKRACDYKLFLAAIGFIAIPTTAPHAGTLIADLEANFQPSSTVGNTTANFGGGAGLPDNTGSGHWNYYSLTPTISPDVDDDLPDLGQPGERRHQRLCGYQ